MENKIPVSQWARLVGLSTERARQYARADRVDGAELLYGRLWVVPSDSPRPRPLMAGRHKVAIPADHPTKENPSPQSPLLNIARDQRDSLSSIVGGEGPLLDIERFCLSHMDQAPKEFANDPYQLVLRWGWRAWREHLKEEVGGKRAQV